MKPAIGIGVPEQDRLAIATGLSRQRMQIHEKTAWMLRSMID